MAERMANTAALMRQKAWENTMPVRVIKDEERKPRATMQGKFSTLPEIEQLWQTKMPEGHSIEVELPEATIEQLKKDGAEKPIQAVVNSIRRKIATDNLSLEVYANSDGKSFTVKRAPTTSKSPKNGKGKSGK